jgi:hypothetical protein
MKQIFPVCKSSYKHDCRVPAICDEMSFFSCPRLLSIREFFQSANHPVEGVAKNRAEIAGRWPRNLPKFGFSPIRLVQMVRQRWQAKTRDSSRTQRPHPTCADVRKMGRLTPGA